MKSLSTDISQDGEGWINKCALEHSLELLINEAFKYRYFSGLGKLWKIPASRQFLGKLPASDQSSTSQQTKNTILSKDKIIWEDIKICVKHLRRNSTN